MDCLHLLANKLEALCRPGVVALNVLDEGFGLLDHCLGFHLRLPAFTLLCNSALHCLGSHPEI